jgi:hypothetical protein
MIRTDVLGLIAAKCFCTTPVYKTCFSCKLPNEVTAKQMTASPNQIYDIRLKDIEISDDNVRESRATTDLDELAASIELLGLLQPVVLKGEPGKPKYELIGGQRRFLAHQTSLSRTLGRKSRHAKVQQLG